MGLPQGKTFDDTFSLFDTDHECDGQTDRQTDMMAIACAHLQAMLCTVKHD